MALSAVALSAPLMPTTAEACGPYGPRTPEDEAAATATWAHYANGDGTLWIAKSKVKLDGDVAYVRLHLEGTDGNKYRQVMKLHRAEGAWAVSWKGKVRPRRARA